MSLANLHNCTQIIFSYSFPWLKVEEFEKYALKLSESECLEDKKAKENERENYNSNYSLSITTPISILDLKKTESSFTNSCLKYLYNQKKIPKKEVTIVRTVEFAVRTVDNHMYG